MAKFYQNIQIWQKKMIFETTEFEMDFSTISLDFIELR